MVHQKLTPWHLQMIAWVLLWLCEGGREDLGWWPKHYLTFVFSKFGRKEKTSNGQVSKVETTHSFLTPRFPAFFIRHLSTRYFSFSNRPLVVITADRLRNEYSVSKGSSDKSTLPSVKLVRWTLVLGYTAQTWEWPFSSFWHWADFPFVIKALYYLWKAILLKIRFLLINNPKIRVQHEAWSVSNSDLWAG